MAKKGHASSELGLAVQNRIRSCQPGSLARAAQLTLLPARPSSFDPYSLRLKCRDAAKTVRADLANSRPPPFLALLAAPASAVYTHPLNGNETNARGNSGILRQVPDDRGTARNNSMKLPNCNAAELSWTGGSRRCRFPRTRAPYYTEFVLQLLFPFRVQNKTSEFRRGSSKIPSIITYIQPRPIIQLSREVCQKYALKVPAARKRCVRARTKKYLTPGQVQFSNETALFDRPVRRSLFRRPPR